MSEFNIYEEVRTLVKIMPEFSKYKTGKKVPASGMLPGKRKDVTLEMDEYEFPMGDLILDYVKHLNKGWWRRKRNHKEVARAYLLVMNHVLRLKVNI